MSELEEIQNALPSTYYADLPLVTRVRNLVMGWQRAIVAVNDFEEAMAESMHECGEALIETEARLKLLEEALRAYHNLAPAVAECVNECGEAVLYTTLHQANVKAEAALIE